MKRFPVVESAVFSIILALDQLTKVYIAYRIPYGSSVPIIPNVVWFTTTHNRGTIWGLAQGGNFIFAGIAVLVVIGILIFAPKVTKSLWAKIAIGAILGGAIGNLIDRFTRGFVIDFIDFGWFPVFNVADMGIVLGAIGLAILMLLTPSKVQ